MATIAGNGAVPGGSGNLSGNSTGGREYLDISYPVTANASITSVNISVGSAVGAEGLSIKVRRETVPGTYSLVGESQTETSISGNQVYNFVINTPFDVLVGDIISIQHGETSSNRIFASTNGAAEIRWTGGDATGDISGLNLLDNFDLSVEAFGTIAAGDTITITSPSTELDKVKQRDGSGQATFTVSGTISAPGTPPTSILYDLDGGPDQVLDASPTTTFSGNVTVTDQQVLTVKYNNALAVTDSARLTSAVYILGWGESTQAGRGTSNQTVVPTGNNPTPLMYKSGVVSDLTDPTGVDGSAAGSHWPRVAQRYSDDGIPVLVANLGQGSATLSLWTKPGTYYTSIVNAVADLGGFSFAESIIGANDQSAGTLQATAETQLGSIVDDLFTDYGLKTYVTYYPVGDGIANTPTAMRAAFDAVIASNANAIDGGDLITIDIDIATTPGNDGVHLKSSADLTTAGDIIYTALTAGESIVLDSGSYALTGTAIDIRQSFAFPLDSGAYALTGTALNFSFTYNFTLENGAYNLTGTPLRISDTANPWSVVPNVTTIWIQES